MMPRFRLPVSQEYAESCLAMAVAVEVESRGHSISPDGDFEQCVKQTAAWTVNASPRHSLLLAGRYGNGKTTFLRALQSLVNAFDLRDPMTGKRMRMPLYNAVALTEMHRTSVAEWHNVARAPLLAIDDLGTEPREVMEFGNMTAPMRSEASRMAETNTRIPMERWGVPEDLAGAAIFLASDASDYVNGFTIAVDGGFLAKS